MSPDVLMEKLQDQGLNVTIEENIPIVTLSAEEYEKRNDLFSKVKEMGYNRSFGVRQRKSKEKASASEQENS